MDKNITIIKALPLERWTEYRDLRMKAIESDPTAFHTTMEDENNRTEKQWKDRLISTGTPRMFFAEYEGKIVGMIGTNVQVMEKIRHSGSVASFFLLIQVLEGKESEACCCKKQSSILKAWAI